MNRLLYPIDPAVREPGKVAFSDPRRSITYGELNEATHNLATHLRANGLNDGDRVAIWLPNCVEWVIACLAAIRAGGTAVPVSYVATPAEVGYRFDDGQCVGLVTMAEQISVLSELSETMEIPRIQVLIGAEENGDTLNLATLCASPAPGTTAGSLLRIRRKGR